jgi:hypothetical protein
MNLLPVGLRHVCYVYDLFLYDTSVYHRGANGRTGRISGIGGQHSKALGVLGLSRDILSVDHVGIEIDKNDIQSKLRCHLG